MHRSTLIYMSEHDEFLEQIERFLKRHKMGHTTFGMKALRRLAFVGRLRMGKTVTLETKARVEDFMRNYEPNAQAKREQPTRGKKKGRGVAKAA